MSTLDHFTERSKKVLRLAQEEAHQFNHNYLGTEHLLLGIVREEEGVAARVLRDLGVTLLKARETVEFIVPRGKHEIIGELGLTPRTNTVIILAKEEANSLNHHYIGTEHLLLGIIREGEGIAAGVLESLGLNLEAIRQEVLKVFEEKPATDLPKTVLVTYDVTLERNGVDEFNSAFKQLIEENPQFKILSIVTTFDGWKDKSEPEE
jgi:ATP-dependent Clp protease ATP-binding subunit ClpC